MAFMIDMKIASTDRSSLFVSIFSPSLPSYNPTSSVGRQSAGSKAGPIVAALDGGAPLNLRGK